MSCDQLTPLVGLKVERFPDDGDVDDDDDDGDVDDGDDDDDDDDGV